MTTSPAKPKRERKSLFPVKGTESHATSWGPGFIAKLCIMLMINALLLFIGFLAWNEKQNWVLALVVVLLIVVNWVYFSKRMIPMKYLLPGLIFLLIFQVFVVFYTGFVAFTNYGDGHNSTKEAAIRSLLLQNQVRVEGSKAYRLTVVERGGDLGFAIVVDGEVRAGTAESAMQPVSGAKHEDGKPVEIPGWKVLTYQEVLSRQNDVTTLKVPFSEDPNEGSIQTQDAREGYQYAPTLKYDKAADTMKGSDGKIYRASPEGKFVAADGTSLNVGWRVLVGFDNFAKAFSDSRYATPFWNVLIWNFAFAFLSVATTFLLGLGLAMLFNNTRMQGKKIYRMIMILPYAFPSFMTALLFAGMMNHKFGFFNQVIFGSEIPWLTDQWLAKFSLVMVNLWLGFPYMFLVCTGALQAIPSDMLEAAKIDGASKFRTWRSVTMPLLFVAVAPLLIASFAFNFNNFSLVKMLTDGGPRMVEASAPIGHTDILISMVYNISGLDGRAERNFGLASALSLVIFLIVAVISAISFKKTQALEDIN